MCIQELKGKIKKILSRSTNKVKLTNIGAVAIILFIGLFFYHNSSILAIFIAMILFVLSDLSKRLEYWNKQEDLLKQILNDIEYVSEKDGHIDYFKSALIPNGYPHHGISKFNLEFYLSNLAHKINAIPTSELIKKLRKANDKIMMLNEYRESEKNWEAILDHNKTTKRKGGYLNDVLDELGSLLKEIQKIIHDKFKVS